MKGQLTEYYERVSHREGSASNVARCRQRLSEVLVTGFADADGAIVLA